MLPPAPNKEDWSPTLADFTSPSLIIPYLEAGDATTAIRELSTSLQREGLITDLLQFYQAVLNREFLCHTVTEPGWAMPHAVGRHLTQPYFALGRWTPPRLWLKSGQVVKLIFLMAVPETDARGYLNLLSGVARLSKRPELIDQILSAGDAKEMFGILRGVQLPSRAALV